MLYPLLKKIKKHKPRLEDFIMQSPAALNQVGRLLLNRDSLTLMCLHMKPEIFCYRQLARSALLKNTSLKNKK